MVPVAESRGRDAQVSARGGAHKKIHIGPPGASSHVEGERVCPRFWGHTKKHGVPHASWRWSQGQRPAPSCGTPPHARRPAAADGGGSGLSPSPRPDRCRRRPAAGVRPAGRTASRPARGWGGVRGAGDSRVRGGAGGDATGNGTLYFLYSVLSRARICLARGFCMWVKTLDGSADTFCQLLHRKLNDPDWT